jgi:hypothetical protein
MKKMRSLLLGSATAAALLLGACGGGGGGGSSAPAPNATPTGSVNVQVTDGPSDEFQHVWVTITAIAFHTDPNAAWSSTDAVWQKTTLPAPVTIDLTTLNNGVLNNLFSGIALPVGTYRQIRFFFDGAEQGLDASALATHDSTGAALQWNDQVEFLDGRNGWAITESPLEIAYPTQGIQLTGTFNVTAGSTLSLAVDFDLEHIIVPFNHGGQTYFTMRPTLTYFDMSEVGAISGTVNPAQLCQTVAAEIAASPGCAFNLVVKAELLTTDGTRHHVVRETTVDPVTGNFTLYPLATKDASGNAIAAYDVLIRGREMETMLVTGVPVTAGTAPGGSGSSAPTSLQSTAIVATLNNGEYTAQFLSPLAPLSAGYAIFQQTLPGSGAVPYEVRWRNTDPFTGMFRDAIPLQGSTSSIHLAPYNAGNTLAFAAVTPQEGSGAFTVAENEVAYYALSTGAVMLPPVSPAVTQTFTPGVPTLIGGVQPGTIAVTLSFSGINVDNQCELVLARFAAIVDTYDCSSMLSNTVPATFNLAGVPAGTSATPVPGAYYYAYVRLWSTAAPKATRRIVPLPGFVDLRSSTSAPLNGAVPGA